MELQQAAQQYCCNVYFSQAESREELQIKTKHTISVKLAITSVVRYRRRHYMQLQGCYYRLYPSASPMKSCLKAPGPYWARKLDVSCIHLDLTLAVSIYGPFIKSIVDLVLRIFNLILKYLLSSSLAQSNWNNSLSVCALPVFKFLVFGRQVILTTKENYCLTDQCRSGR